jgi:hypothetical protein
MTSETAARIIQASLRPNRFAMTPSIRFLAFPPVDTGCAKPRRDVK